MPRCIALLSGALDSLLAIRLMQLQSIKVEALHFQTIYTNCHQEAAQAAQQLGIKLTVVKPEADYFELIQSPRFGYGRAANPCLDCRIYMFRKASEHMRQHNADFLVSGEIVGQRPKDQKRRDLEIISFHSQLDDHLLRPLSALCLPPTLPERTGQVDRNQLYGFTGSSRKGLIQLAEKLRVEPIPQMASGCALMEPAFGRKVFDLVNHKQTSNVVDFESLKYGRHFRLDTETKIIVGRNAADNNALRSLHESNSQKSTLLMSPREFAGPVVLVTGRTAPHAVDVAGALLLRFSRINKAGGQTAEIDDGQSKREIVIRSNPAVECMKTVTEHSVKG
ncbi:MAG: hypothetical protein GY768_15585 [Planctomycetaceae bacterium]|nr:hypothetical protein [Planctomycetaceae bacterium]